MPSKRPQSRKRPKKRQKRVWSPPADYTPWIWALLALNVAVGLAFSPVTGVRVVRVVGAQDSDQERLSSFLRLFKDEPALRLNEAQVCTLALENGAVESAEFRANLFGRGVLALAYRRPVAQVVDQEGLYLSSRGTLYTAEPGLPVKFGLEAEGGTPVANLSVFSSWRSGVASWMCDNIAERLPDRTWRMVVSTSGFVTLVPESGGVVELGSFEDPDKKVQALSEILHDDPKMLEGVSKLVLSSPSNPVKVR